MPKAQYSHLPAQNLMHRFEFAPEDFAVYGSVVRNSAAATGYDFSGVVVHIRTQTFFPAQQQPTTSAPPLRKSMKNV